MPGSTPATSQLDWLISTTAMIVLSWSRATRDRLKSFGWGIRALHQFGSSDDGAISSPPAPYHLPAGGRWIRTFGLLDRPHRCFAQFAGDSLLEGDGFEPSVPH